MKKFYIFLLFLSFNIFSTEKIEIGVFGFPKGNIDYIENVFKLYELLGIDRVYYHTMKIDEGLFKISSKYKIELIPILNTYAYAGMLLKNNKEINVEKWAQIYKPSGKVRPGMVPSYYYPSILSQEVRELMREEVKNIVEQGKPLGLKTIALDDEFGLGLGWQGEGWTDFNQYCIDYFKKNTGLNPPELRYKEPGIIDENSSLYKWISVIGYPSYSSPLMKFHNEDLKKVAKEIDPNIKVVQMPGGEYGELDAVVIEVYQYMFYTPELSVAWQIDYVRNFQEDKAKPIWPLIGWYQVVPLPEWIGENITLTAKIALAWGAKSIDFASIPSFEKEKFPFYNRKDLEEAYVNLIKEIRNLQPLLLKIYPKQKKGAVLFSNTTEAYQKILDWDKAKILWENEKKWSEKPWEHSQSFDIAIPSLLLSHIPVEVITENNILKGELEKYEYLFLINCQYLPKSVFDKIISFQKSGKLVFADKSSFVKPEGAINISIDFSIWSRMIESGLRAKCWRPEKADNHFFQWNLVRECAKILKEELENKIKKDVLISSPYIVYTFSTDGKNDYLFLINTDLINAHKTEIKLLKGVSSIQDILKNKFISLQKKGNETSFEISIEKANWVILKINE